MSLLLGFSILSRLTALAMIGVCLVTVLFLFSLSPLMGKVAKYSFLFIGLTLGLLAGDACHWTTLHVQQDRALGWLYLYWAAGLLVGALVSSRFQRFWERRRKTECTVCGYRGSWLKLRRDGCPQCGADGYTAVKW